MESDKTIDQMEINELHDLHASIVRSESEALQLVMDGNLLLDKTGKAKRELLKELESRYLKAPVQS